MQILREDVDLAMLDEKKLTNDCKLIRRANGQIDLARGRAAHIFDHYWDKGVKLLRIWHAGGTRNPKFQQPEF